MKSIFRSILLASLLVCTSCGEADHPSDAPSETQYMTPQENLYRYFEALREMDKFNGVVFVNQEGRPLINHAFNMREAGHSMHIEVHSQFDIHSVSKVMLRFLFQKKVDVGELAWTDLLSDYLPNFPRGDEMTLEMLINHTTGLPRELSVVNDKMLFVDGPDVVDLIAEETLLFDPGSDAQYSNLGYQLLYHILSVIEEKPFAQVLESRLFAPLGMVDSGSHFNGTRNNLSKLAVNHEMADDSMVIVPNVTGEEFRQARVYSTADDLMKMLLTFQEQQAARAISKDGILAHSGGADGIRTHIHADLNTNSNFVMLSNFDGIPFVQILEDVESILAGNQVAIPQPLNRIAVDVSQDVLARYSGNYAFLDFGDLVLKIEPGDNRLLVYQDGELAGELSAENDTVFFDDPQEEESFEFVSNDSGSYDVLMGWKGAKLLGRRLDAD